MTFTNGLPKVGVVTVTYNSGSVLAEFLSSLRKQSYSNLASYVIDNVSADDTLNIIAAAGISALTTIKNSANLGFAEGSNQGIRAAMSDGCELILLINNDTEFGPSLVSNLVSELQVHGADMIVPKMTYHVPPDRLWYAGGFLNPKRGYSGEHWGLDEHDSGQFETPRQVEFSPACCTLIRRAVFESIGCLDSNYFAYFEDVDFCYRATLAGKQLWYTPAATVVHKVGSLSGGSEGAFFLRHNTRNHVYFLLKNLGVKGAMYLPAYQALILYKWLARKYTTRSFLTVENAFWEGIRMFWTRQEVEHGI